MFILETPDASQKSDYASPLASLMSSEVTGGRPLPLLPFPASSQEYPENLNNLRPAPSTSKASFPSQPVAPASKKQAGAGAGAGAGDRTRPDGASPNQLLPKHDIAKKVCRAVF